MDLLLIPREILREIISFLHCKDICSVQLTCKTLRDIGQLDSIWSKRCWIEYNIKVPPGHGLARIFFQKVLFRYGHLIGFWRAHADYYGGLLHIKYENWKLLGIDLQPPKEPHVTRPIKQKLLFTIFLKDDTATVQCTINPSKPHSCILSYGPKKIATGGQVSTVLTRQCGPDVKSEDHQKWEDSTQELEHWLSEQSEFDHQVGFASRDLFIYKYLVLRQCDMKTNYSRMFMPVTTSNVPIKPGVFKGTYSAHGLELVMLTYEGHDRVKASKITGDPYIPAGETTFRADLPYSMVLTKEQQLSYSSLVKIEPAMSAICWQELPNMQPYVTPHDFHERHTIIPDNCQYRFHGFGQIAGSGFSSPKFVPGHWIIFNEDFFVFLWITLKSVSIYHRVKELE